jgi:hypothetical protein
MVNQSRGIMVLNTTFNKISVISWLSVLLVEKPEYPEKTTDKHNVVSSTPKIAMSGIQTHNGSGDRH